MSVHFSTDCSTGRCRPCHNDTAIRNGAAIRNDTAIAAAFMHAQWLSSVQKRHIIRVGVQKRRINRDSVPKRRTNRAVHLGKSHNQQPRPAISQF
ncbi:MAG: hypothetical protein U0J93_03590 [Parolsenella sp.]|uniref:hypothetical protein n=1 Tax=Parolsenella sp. TaxID=2083006 RepID=UPI002E798CDE|nr:hypothetical protein [Parolsenella sp.]MEE1372449.1 hypothetical protein [Parolsenella sp.]